MQQHLVAWQAGAAAAGAFLREGLALAHTQGRRYEAARALAGLTAVAACAGQAARAATLAGAVAAQLAALGAQLAPADAARYTTVLEAARAALGVTAWATAWAAGQALSLDQAVTQALAVDGAGGGRSPEL